MAGRDGRPLVGILMGSDSDWEMMEPAAQRLAAFDVPYEVRVMSAHRSPKVVGQYAQTGAAARPRRVHRRRRRRGAPGRRRRGWTTLPVIGVPVASTPLNGIDALLATVQMPAGVPVATVAVGKAGAENAAILAAQILSVKSRAAAAAAREVQGRAAAERRGQGPATAEEASP